MAPIGCAWKSKRSGFTPYTLCDSHRTEHRRSWCKRPGAVDVIASVDGRASDPKADPRVVRDGGESLKWIGEQKRET